MMPLLRKMEMGEKIHLGRPSQYLRKRKNKNILKTSWILHLLPFKPRYQMKVVENVAQQPWGKWPLLCVHWNKIFWILIIAICFHYVMSWSIWNMFFYIHINHNSIL
jgi:hypothetical protein